MKQLNETITEILMPLLIIVFGSTSIGVAIALYILRKYNPHN